MEMRESACNYLPHPRAQHTRSAKPKFLVCFTAEMRLQGAAAIGSAVHEGGMYELCLLQPHGMQAPWALLTSRTNPRKIMQPKF